MGSVVKGVASLFGGGKRRREQAAANRQLQAAQAKKDAFKFSNVYEGLEGPQFQGYDAASGQAVTMDPSVLENQQAALGRLGPAQGYEAQGYDAAQTNVAGLMRGDDAGLTNTMANLQVSTAGAEMAAQEADQALAQSQDLAAQAGTGAGGATALAAAAAKSKAGIRADLDRQVKANEQLRAQGEQQRQRDQLAQENLASKFDLGQQQFNVGQMNEARRFSADAMNQANRFGAQAANQFALSRFGAENQMNQFNVGNQFNFARANMDAQNRFALANMDAQNRALMFGAQQAGKGAEAAFEVDKLKRDFDLQQQSFEYQKLLNKEDRALARKSQADAARAKATQDLVGGIAGAADAAVKAFSDRRLKEDIKLVGLSPSGIKIYNFKYKFIEGIFQGVMSDEIPSFAVIKDNSGFDKVDYSKIDVKFKKI